MKNKDSKSKFAFINGDEIKSRTFLTKNKISFNDLDNVFYCDSSEESLDSYFDLYNIPYDYRKIALKISSPISFAKKAEDYLTKIEFYVNTKRIVDYTTFKGTNKNFNNYYFNSILRTISYDDLMEFYKELNEKGILKDYINAIANFYKIHEFQRNIEKYNEIMQKYRMGEFGEEMLNLSDILTRANEQNLIHNMTLNELLYMIDNTAGSTKVIFIEEIKRRMENKLSNKDTVHVKSLNKK